MFSDRTYAETELQRNQDLLERLRDKDTSDMDDVGRQALADAIATTERRVAEECDALKVLEARETRQDVQTFSDGSLSVVLETAGRRIEVFADGVTDRLLVHIFKGGRYVEYVIRSGLDFYDWLVLRATYCADAFPHERARLHLDDATQPQPQRSRVERLCSSCANRYDCDSQDPDTCGQYPELAAMLIAAVGGYDC